MPMQYPEGFQNVPAKALLLESDVTMKGWMLKKSGRDKVSLTALGKYDKRFFVILGGWVYYFLDENSKKEQGRFSLEGYSSHVVLAEEERCVALPHVFKVYPKKNSGRTWYFAPDNENSSRQWRDAFISEIERFHFSAPVKRGSASVPEKSHQERKLNEAARSRSVNSASTPRFFCKSSLSSSQNSESRESLTPACVGGDVSMGNRFYEEIDNFGSNDVGFYKQENLDSRNTIHQIGGVDNNYEAIDLFPEAPPPRPPKPFNQQFNMRRLPPEPPETPVFFEEDNYVSPNEPNRSRFMTIPNKPLPPLPPGECDDEIRKPFSLSCSSQTISYNVNSGSSHPNVHIPPPRTPPQVPHQATTDQDIYDDTTVNDLVSNTPTSFTPKRNPVSLKTAFNKFGPTPLTNLGSAFSPDSHCHVEELSSRLKSLSSIDKPRVSNPDLKPSKETVSPTKPPPPPANKKPVSPTKPPPPPASKKPVSPTKPPPPPASKKPTSTSSLSNLNPQTSSFLEMLKPPVLSPCANSESGLLPKSTNLPTTQQDLSSTSTRPPTLPKPVKSKPPPTSQNKPNTTSQSTAVNHLQTTFSKSPTLSPHAKPQGPSPLLKPGKKPLDIAKNKTPSEIDKNRFVCDETSSAVKLITSKLESKFTPNPSTVDQPQHQGVLGRAKMFEPLKSNNIMNNKPPVTKKPTPR